MNIQFNIIISISYNSKRIAQKWEPLYAKDSHYIRLFKFNSHSCHPANNYVLSGLYIHHFLWNIKPLFVVILLFITKVLPRYMGITRNISVSKITLHRLTNTHCISEQCCFYRDFFLGYYIKRSFHNTTAFFIIFSILNITCCINLSFTSP